MSSAGEHFALGRLWSLWDIMNQFDAGKLFGALMGVTNSAQTGFQNLEFSFSARNFSILKGQIAHICEEMKRLDLKTSLLSAQELRKIVEQEVKMKTVDQMPAPPPAQITGWGPEWAHFDQPAWSRYKHYAFELAGRVYAEMSQITMITVSSRLSEYLVGKEPLFGQGVFDAFPSANDDIAEAGACLALQRGTACVMHLSRAQEVSLKALAATIGVGEQNDWGSYIREINIVLDRRSKASPKRSAEEEFYAGAVAEFDNIKRAWRNPSMHPRGTYSADRAEEIFNAIKSFMRHLATKVSEPKLT